jgi:hypothetical protein
MQYTLNDDQAAALRAVADMLPIQGSSTPPETPVTLIHGVFGAGLCAPGPRCFKKRPRPRPRPLTTRLGAAGKSYLLAVTIVMLARLFDIDRGNRQEAGAPEPPRPWKVLLRCAVRLV